MAESGTGGIFVQKKKSFRYFSVMILALCTIAVGVILQIASRTIRENKRLTLENQEYKKQFADFVGIGIRHRGDFLRRGRLVTRVFPGTPAEKAKLKYGDLILSVNNQHATAAVLNSAISDEQNIDFEIQRGNRIIRVQVMPAKLRKIFTVIPAK